MTTLICSDCDIEMTRHAAKVIQTGSDARPVDPELGGVLLERHACPACGCSASSYPDTDHRK